MLSSLPIRRARSGSHPHPHLLLLLLITLCVPACDRPSYRRVSEEDARIVAQRIKTAKAPVNVEQVQSFFARQEAHARRIKAGEKGEAAPETWPFFAAAQSGDWRKVTRLYHAMAARSYQFDNPDGPDARLNSTIWQPINESYRFYEQCANGSPRHALEYGREVIASLPPGAVLLAGTDSSRFVVTGLCRNHLTGDPVFVISPNALADGLYLEHLRSKTADKLAMLSIEDSQKAFTDYVDDASRRLKSGQLKPGEDVGVVGGSTQISGSVAVMEINARLVRRLFELNPREEFFVVEGYPLDWMQPLLEPHGFVLRVQRDRVKSLSPELVARDREFWDAKCRVLLGGWWTAETSTETICSFATKVFVQRDLHGFTGDRDYVTSGLPWQTDPPYTAACLTYALARVSSAGIYERLAREAAADSERQRWSAEADLAYRQAFALCPYSPEAVLRYVSFLSGSDRWQEARAVIEVGARLNPKGIGPFVERVKNHGGRRAGEGAP